MSLFVKRHWAMHTADPHLILRNILTKQTVKKVTDPLY
uniref:Uncharacterized protein n=1 Tax=Anguilla anguilla TaxID=7936 RepID=A0A0E9VW49_ANGAN